MASRGGTSLTLPAEPASLGKVLEVVRSVAEQAGIGLKPTTQLELAVEEVLVNILKHAYGGGPGEVQVSCRITAEGAVEVEFADQGPPFDPLSRPEPDLAATVDERPIGGLGVHLAKTLTDQMTYRREDGSNILTLLKKAHS